MSMLHCFECTSKDEIQEICTVYHISYDAVFNVKCLCRHCKIVIEQCCKTN